MHGTFTGLVSACPCVIYPKPIMTHILTELECCLRIILITALPAILANHSGFSQERKPSSHPCPGPSQVEKQFNMVNYSMINSMVDEEFSREHGGSTGP